MLYRCVEDGCFQSVLKIKGEFYVVLVVMHAQVVIYLFVGLLLNERKFRSMIWKGLQLVVYYAGGIFIFQGKKLKKSKMFSFGSQS